MEDPAAPLAMVVAAVLLLVMAEAVLLPVMVAVLPVTEEVVVLQDTEGVVVVVPQAMAVQVEAVAMEALLVVDTEDLAVEEVTGAEEAMEEAAAAGEVTACKKWLPFLSIPRIMAFNH